MRIGYVSLDKNIFLKIAKERRFYVILDRFISLLITIFISFYSYVATKKLLVDYIAENSNNGEIIANVITKPVLQINDGLESKVEAIADKASFIDKDNIVLENILVKGNNDFVLKANEGNINIRNGEILLMKRPTISIFDN